MQLNNLQLFLGSIDLLTALVAVSVCIVMTILKKVLKEKLKTSISVYLPACDSYTFYSENYYRRN